MRIKYNTEKLGEILNDLSLLTGITINFADTENKLLFECRKSNDFCTAIQEKRKKKSCCAVSDAELLERCKKSGKYEWHICHAGLYDSAMPIEKDGILAGYLIMGRVRSQKQCAVSELPHDGELLRLYSRLPFFDDEQLEGLRRLLPNILFSNAIEIEHSGAVEEAARFIRKNIKAELSVKGICAAFFISKNLLYSGFREAYGCTVNEYITGVRLEEAARLLKETKMPVYEVCESVGMYNYTYFSKLFKKHIGLAPTAYRKVGKEENKNGRV